MVINPAMLRTTTVSFHLNSKPFLKKGIAYLAGDLDCQGVQITKLVPDPARVGCLLIAVEDCEASAHWSLVAFSAFPEKGP